jgi:hypothetical protein
VINLDEILNDKNDYLDIFEYLIKDEMKISDAYDLMIDKFSAKEIFDYLAYEEKIIYEFERPSKI